MLRPDLYFVAATALSPSLSFALQGAQAVNEVHQTVPSFTLAGCLVACLPSLALRDPFMGEMLEASLEGVDCNDDGKTSASVNFVQDVCRWLPMGVEEGGWCPEEDVDVRDLAASWGPRMLERVFAVIENEVRELACTRATPVVPYF